MKFLITLALAFICSVGFSQPTQPQITASPYSRGILQRTNQIGWVQSIGALTKDDVHAEFYDSFKRPNTGVGEFVLGNSDSGHQWFTFRADGGLSWSTNYLITNGSLAWSRGAGLTNGNTNWYSYPAVALRGKPTKFGIKFDLLPTAGGIHADAMTFLMCPNSNSINESWHIGLSSLALNITYITNGNFITFASIATPLPDQATYMTNGVFEIIISDDTITVKTGNSNSWSVTDPIVRTKGGKYLVVENIGNTNIANQFFIKSIYAGQSDTDAFLSKSNGVASRLTVNNLVTTGIFTNNGGVRVTNGSIRAMNGQFQGAPTYGYRFGGASSASLDFDDGTIFTGYPNSLILLENTGARSWAITPTNGNLIPSSSNQVIGTSSKPIGGIVMSATSTLDSGTINAGSVHMNFATNAGHFAVSDSASNLTFISPSAAASSAGLAAFTTDGGASTNKGTIVGGIYTALFTSNSTIYASNVANVFNAQSWGWIPDGTDRSTEASNLLTAVYNSGGGTIFFPAATNRYRMDSQMFIPNSVGQPTAGTISNQPNQVNIRLTGAGGGQNWYNPYSQGASQLDLRYTGTNGGKIETRGRGTLQIDNLTIRDGGSSNDVPFIHATSTSLTLKNNTFIGQGGTTNQDAIVLGGTTNAIQSGINGGFQGYGSVIRENHFTRLNRGVYLRTWANNIIITDNSWQANQTNATPASCAIEIDGTVSASDSGIGNVITGNLIEMDTYKYGIVLRGASYNYFAGNSLWDSGTSTNCASFYLITNSSLGNSIVSGYYSTAYKRLITGEDAAAGQATTVVGGNPANPTGLGYGNYSTELANGLLVKGNYNPTSNYTGGLVVASQGDASRHVSIGYDRTQEAGIIRADSAVAPSPQMLYLQPDPRKGVGINMSNGTLLAALDVGGSIMARTNLTVSNSITASTIAATNSSTNSIGIYQNSQVGYATNLSLDMQGTNVLRVGKSLNGAVVAEFLDLGRRGVNGAVGAAGVRIIANATGGSSSTTFQDGGGNGLASMSISLLSVPAGFGIGGQGGSTSSGAVNVGNAQLVSTVTNKLLLKGTTDGGFTGQGAGSALEMIPANSKNIFNPANASNATFAVTNISGKGYVTFTDGNNNSLTITSTVTTNATGAGTTNLTIYINGVQFNARLD